ncbi:MAG: hypothetical protein ACKV0T_19940 [Planctomycetales bacterium]
MKFRRLDQFNVQQRVLGHENGFQPFDVESLYFRDVCIANAVNLSDFEDDPIQVTVCETCGNVGCNSGGWIHMRRIGDDVLWIPPRRLTARESKLVCELFPPEYIARDDIGIPVFGPDLYDELRRQLPRLPHRATVQPIQMCEALALVQAEAPFELLGRAPRIPQLQPDLVLAVTDGELAAETAVVNQFAKEHVNSASPLEMVSIDASYRAIEFHLDAPGFPAWNAFCRLPDTIGIILGSWRPMRIANTNQLTAAEG